MMTPEQRKLVHKLVVLPPSGQRQISKQEFAAQFPAALDAGNLSLSILDAARSNRDADDLQCAMIVGHVFGFSLEHEAALCELLSAEWHSSHEDVVSALVRIGATSEKAVDALFEATQLVPQYLEYDSSRALAVKAIWGIGKIPGTYSEAKLKLLAYSQSAVLRTNAENQLRRRLERT